MICTNCNDRIIRGQKYFRNKKGAHHADCPNESPWIDEMVKRWFFDQGKICKHCGMMACCGTCESEKARMSQLCREIIANYQRMLRR
jgi:hypothetical protein